ncbi:uncharacterized protein LOC126046705 [Accipiter gentilis]|uniref:uncharacterized protein LOC126046705 n=1 Tax=Astur gentilis TaxID=8957 RepID=UPI002110888A|nr:uncharacterized protein LOC126046705 [Accipiter gentilis]
MPSPPHLPLTHTGLQMVPWGGCFNSQDFYHNWTSTDLRPSATFTIGQGISSPPAAALQGPQDCGIPLVSADQQAPQGQLQLFLPYNHQGSEAAPASPVLPLTLPSYQHLNGQYTQDSLSGAAQPLGAPLGSGSPPGNAIPRDDGTQGGAISPSSEVPMDVDVPPVIENSLGSDVLMDDGILPDIDISLGSDVPMHEDTLPGSDNPLGSDTTPSHSVTLHAQDNRNPGVIPASNIVLLKKVPPVEAMRHPDCSLGAVGISQNDPSKVPMAKDPGGTSGTVSHHKSISLPLPKEKNSSDYGDDYGVPSTSKAFLSTIKKKAEDPRRDAGTNLPPSQGSVSECDTKLERRGKKRRPGPLPKTCIKRKAPEDRAGINLPPPQGSVSECDTKLEKRGKKRHPGPLPKTCIKRKAPEDGAGVNLPPPQGSVSERDTNLEKREEKQFSDSLPKVSRKRKAPEDSD